MRQEHLQQQRIFQQQQKQQKQQQQLQQKNSLKVRKMSSSILCNLAVIHSKSSFCNQSKETWQGNLIKVTCENYIVTNESWFYNFTVQKTNLFMKTYKPISYGSFK